MGMSISLVLLVAAGVMNVVIFLVLLFAVLAVFRMDKRTRQMERGLQALHEELQQAKQDILRATRES